MRLIDADTLINAVLQKYLKHERNNELLFTACEIKQDIADIICDAPIIELKNIAYEFIKEEGVRKNETD